MTMHVDPLTASWSVLRRWMPTLCDCNPAAYHSERCPLTPLYATLVDEQGSPFLYGLWGTTLAGWGFCNPDNPWCKNECTIDSRDNRIIDPDCFR
jgi:hypothetical protein